MPLATTRPMRIDRSLWRFLSVGVVNTLVGLGVIYACMTLGGLGDVASNAMGYAVGLAVSYTLNKRWTFVHQGDAWRSLLRFLLVFAVAYAANLFIVLTAIRVLHFNRYLAQPAGIVAYTILSYLGSRYFAFAGMRSSSRERS